MSTGINELGEGMAKTYARICKEIREQNPGICQDLVIIRTYARLIHDAIDALEKRFANGEFKPPKSG
jgi:hypothetical protein